MSGPLSPELAGVMSDRIVVALASRPWPASLATSYLEAAAAHARLSRLFFGDIKCEAEFPPLPICAQQDSV